LKSGMKGPKVQEVEKMLDALHYDYRLKVDKLYTKDTVYNVKRFQKKAKLKQTGIVDKKTYDKLKKAYADSKQPAANEKPDTNTKPADNSSALKLGSTGDAVRNLQQNLISLGYKVTATGKYDESTRYAVMLFQSRNKMKLTGEADSKTLDAIKKQAKEQPSKPETQPDPVNPSTPVTPSKPDQPQNPGTGQGTEVPLPSGLTADEKEMVQLVNQERTSRGLKPYQVDMDLVKVARVKAQDMVSKGYFSHTSPTYGSPFQMMQTFGINFRAAAENIAQNRTVASAHTSFMNSSGHKANILNPSYEYVAIAVVDGGPYGKTFVQMFIQK